MRRHYLVILISLFILATTVPIYLSAQSIDEPNLIDPFVPPPGSTNQIGSASAPVLGIQSDNPTEEDALVQLLNDMRQRLNLQCLVGNESLRNSAYLHSKYMHDNNVFAHVIGTSTPASRAQAQGYGSTVVGENIAAGKNGIRDSAKEAFDSWAASRTHYFNMLNSNYDEIGVGWYSGTLNFEDYWTMDLGAEAGVNAQPCSGTPDPITHLPVVQNPLNINTTRPTYQWTRQITTTEGRVPATHFDIEIVDVTDTSIVKVPTSATGPTYLASNICDDTVCTLTLSDELVNGATYTVWIRAWSQTGGYVWSATGVQFKINTSAPSATNTPIPVNPSQVVLSAPSGSVTDGYGNTSFTWNVVENATAYEMYLARADALGVPVIWERFDAARHCNTTTCTLADVAIMNDRFRLYNGVYHAYFREWNAQGPMKDWSSTFQFTVAAAPPALVTLGDVLALTNSTISRPTFTWTLQNTAQNAMWFNVIVTNNLGQIVLNEWVTRSNACGDPYAVDCGYTMPYDLVSTGPYLLYVAGWGPGGFSTGGTFGYVSKSFSLSTTVPQTPAGFTVTANQGHPSFTLANDLNAAWYHIRVASSGGQVTYDNWFYKSPDWCSGLTCTLKPAIDLASGTYQVYLQTWGPAGFNNNNAESWSSPQPLDLTFAAPAVVTNLVATYTDSGSPLLSWQGSQGTTWYAVWLGTATGSKTYHYQWYSAIELGCEDDGVCSISPLIAMPNGTGYTWYVLAYGPGGFSTGGNAQGWAQGNLFNITVSLPGSPSPLTPTAITSTNTSKPTFQWNHQSSVSWYLVSVNIGSTADSEGTPIFADWLPVQALNCRDANICTLEIPGLLGEGHYSWSISPYNPAGLGTSSGVIYFTVDLP